MNGQPYQGGPAVHHSENQEKITLDGRPDESAALFNDQYVLKYMIMRNPLQRTLSGYLDKVERKSTEKGPEAFKRWLEKEFPAKFTWNRMNAHWRAQTTMCGYSLGIHHHFTKLRFEERDKIVDFVYDLIPEVYLKDGWGDEQNLSFRQAASAGTKSTRGTNEKFFEYVRDVEVFEKLEIVFERDIRVLGYEREVEELKAELQRRLEKTAADMV